VGKDFTIIEKGIRYLETNDRLDRSISEIAAMCAVSETYFRRLFKKYSGLSPKEYILRVKIDKAKLILRETNLQVSEIAEMFGISDTAYFCRMFKKRTGVSPLIYRSKEPGR
jgi:AraC-like DNA-binding protein